MIQCWWVNRRERFPALAAHQLEFVFSEIPSLHYNFMKYSSGLNLLVLYQARAIDAITSEVSQQQLAKPIASDSPYDLGVPTCMSEVAQYVANSSTRTLCGRAGHRSPACIHFLYNINCNEPGAYHGHVFKLLLVYLAAQPEKRNTCF